MRAHIALSVEDVAAAIPFYSAIFDREPSVVRDDYAKWMLDDPKLNFAVESRGRRPGVDHLGIQAETEDELETISARMRQAGQPFLDVGRVSCCYANMDKAWIKGLSGEKWEAFYTLDHAEQDYGRDTDHLLDEASGESGADDSPSCC